MKKNDCPLTNSEFELFKILNSKMLMPDGTTDKDSVIGTMIELFQNKGVEKMLRFLKNTPHATREDIYDFLDAM